MRGEYYLLDATFKLKKIDAIEAAFARGRSVEIIRHRRQRYPYANTCGSFFRNFHTSEVPFEINGKQICYVAYYLDKIGVKGVLRVGGAVVSYQHANMIVTNPGATSDDVIQLVRSMQQLVFDHYGIVPQPECQLLGFKTNPLLSMLPTNKVELPNNLQA
jgi:UDP-N-acetylenolpyruvoylglucosamine reductase